MELLSLKRCYCTFIILSIIPMLVMPRKLRSVDRQELDTNPLTNSLEYIWAMTTVAVGDTAVLHCSFDAIFQQLRNGNIDWFRELTSSTKGKQLSAAGASQSVGEWDVTGATPIATGKKLMTEDNRYRVYRPHNSALSVLIIRRAKKKDAGIYRCNLSGSATRHRYMILNVTESKIEAQTSPATLRAKIGNDVTLWCNATGYPKPVVYWTREDRNRKLPDGSYQYWGNGLLLKSASEADTGIYACFLDNFVQPIVSYKFSLMVEDNPWNLDGYKMRFDSKQWYPQDSPEPKPVKTKSYLLMCETRGASKPLPIIRWYRDGKAVRNNKHFYIIEDSPESRSSYASSTLVIMNFLARFQGNYTCVASNVFRMKKLTFYVREYLEPEEVEDSSANPELPIPKIIRGPEKPPISNSISPSVASAASDGNVIHFPQLKMPKDVDIKQIRKAKTQVLQQLDNRRTSTSAQKVDKNSRNSTPAQRFEYAEKSSPTEKVQISTSKTVAIPSTLAPTDDEEMTNSSGGDADYNDDK